MNTNTIQELVAKAIAKDDAAFAELCQHKGRDILYICTQAMGNRQDGEDAAQEVLIKMHRSITALKAPEAFSVWLYRVVDNTCKDLRRKNMKMKHDLPFEEIYDGLETEIRDELPQEYLENAENRQKLIDAIGKLPYVRHMCVMLFYYEEMDYASIARVLSISQKAVANHLQRAKQFLKQEFAATSQVSANFSMLLAAPVLSGVMHEQAAAMFSSMDVAVFLKGSKIATLPLTAVKTITAVQATTVLLGITVGLLAIATASIGFSEATAPATQQAQVAASGGVVFAPSEEGAGQPIYTPGASATPFSLQGQTSGVPAEEAGIVYPKNAILGRVYVSGYGPESSMYIGVAGIRLELVDAKAPEEVLQTTYSLAQKNEGWYLFANLDPGHYMVRAVLPDNARYGRGQPWQPKPVEEDSNTVWLSYRQNSILEVKKDETSFWELPLYYPATLSGRFVFVDRAGNAVEGAEAYLAACKAELRSPEGRRLMVADVGEDGAYRFVNPPIKADGEYSIRLSGASNGGLQEVRRAGSERLTPGTSATIASIAVSDVVSPAVMLQLEGNDCACGHINPQKATITTADSTRVTLGWQIVQEGQTVAAGSTAALTEALQKLAAEGPAGEYTLVVTATDLANNQTTTSKYFTIIGA